MAWNSTFSRVTTKLTGDNLSAADVNLLNDNDEQTQANIEALAGNGTSAPDRTVQECSDAIDSISSVYPILPVRNTVMSSAVDASGYPNFITAGSGLDVNLAATATPFICTVAAGFTSPYDYIFSALTDTSISSLTAYSTCYLYADYNTSTQAVTYGHSIYPYYASGSYIGQRIGAIHAPFNGTNGATTYTDAQGNVWTLANGASLSNSVVKYQTTSLYLQGTDDYAETAAPDMSGKWTIEAWIYPTDSTRASTQVVLYSNLAYYGPSVQINTAGKLVLYVSSNGSSWDVVNGTTGSTVLSDNTWAHVALVFDGSAYKVYLNGAQEISATSSTSSTQPKTLRLGATTDGTSNEFYGYMEDFKFTPKAVYTGAFTAPTAALTVDSVHFFDTSKYIMYYGNPASWSQVYRVFLGDAVTGASTVSSVSNYALLGRYNSGRFAVSTNTTYSKNHNLGTRNYNVSYKGTAYAGGPLYDAIHYYETAYYGTWPSIQLRNSISVRRTVAGDIMLLTNSTGAAVELEIDVKRGF